MAPKSCLPCMNLWTTLPEPVNHSAWTCELPYFCNSCPTNCKDNCEQPWSCADKYDEWAVETSIISPTSLMPKHECAMSHATNVLQRLCSTTEDICNDIVLCFYYLLCLCCLYLGWILLMATISCFVIM